MLAMLRSSRAKGEVDDDCDSDNNEEEEEEEEKEEEAVDDESNSVDDISDPVDANDTSITSGNDDEAVRLFVDRSIADFEHSTAFVVLIPSF